MSVTFIYRLSVFVKMDKYTFTLIGYVLPYYIGEILHRGMHNLSYIYGNACINIAYPYAKVFSYITEFKIGTRTYG